MEQNEQVQQEQEERLPVVDNYVFMHCCSDRMKHHPQRAFQAHLLNLKVNHRNEEMVSLALMFIEALAERNVERPQHMPAWSTFTYFPQEVLLDPRVITLIREVMADEEQPVLYRGKWAGVITLLAKDQDEEVLSELRRIFIPVLVGNMLSDRFLTMYSSDWVHESFVDACAALKPDCHNLAAKPLRMLTKALEFLPNCEAAVKRDNFPATKPALALLQKLENKLEIVSHDEIKLLPIAAAS